MADTVRLWGKDKYEVKGTLIGLLCGLFIWASIFFLLKIGGNSFHRPYLVDGEPHYLSILYSLVAFIVIGFSGGGLYDKFRTLSKSDNAVIFGGLLGAWICISILHIASVLGRFLTGAPFLLPQRNGGIAMISITFAGFLFGLIGGHAFRNIKK